MQEPSTRGGFARWSCSSETRGVRLEGPYTKEFIPRLGMQTSAVTSTIGVAQLRSQLHGAKGRNAHPHVESNLQQVSMPLHGGQVSGRHDAVPPTPPTPPVLTPASAPPFPPETPPVPEAAAPSVFVPSIPPDPPLLAEPVPLSAPPVATEPPLPALPAVPPEVTAPPV